jgi:hypothetical protein
MQRSQFASLQRAVRRFQRQAVRPSILTTLRVLADLVVQQSDQMMLENARGTVWVHEGRACSI